MENYDPRYVQIGKKEVAQILGCSVPDVERRMKNEEDFPKPFKRTDSRNAKLRFRLSEIYAQSAKDMENQ